jgi:transmembrane sensor
MKYDNYQLEDFLKDESFVQWVKNPTEDATLFWENWLSTHPHKNNTISIAKSIILSVRYSEHHVPDSEEMIQVWENILAGEKSKRTIPKPLSNIWISRSMRYAAVLLLATIASLLVWQYQNPHDKKAGEIIAIRHIIQPALITTVKGQRFSVKLPDGSRVILNAESTLSYGSDFGALFRDVNLTGEAFFEVSSNKTKPFRIVTDKLVTTVVGTSFNINAYPEMKQITVAVLTGKVNVAQPEKPESAVSLTPHEMSVFTKKTGVLSTGHMDAEKILGWKDNIIVLKNADYPEIKKVLERWYGVAFMVEKGLVVREEFSAKFRNAPIEKVLDALNYTSRFQYKLVKGTIYVTRKNER